jgi:hypothetical protein
MIDAAPISRWGYAAIAITFLDIAALLAWSPRPPKILVIVFFGCLIIMGAAGFLDTRAYRCSRGDSPRKRAGKK